MHKLSTLLGATSLALAVGVFSGTTLAAPIQGFGNGGGGPGGFNGGGGQTMTVQSVKRNAYDDQHVSLVGRLTQFLGDDDYVFQDKTGTIVVELDDDDDHRWNHIQKDQLIQIYGEVDRDDGRVKIEVDRAHPVKG